MKNLLIALFCSLGCITASAQVYDIEYSASFDEPNDGWNKLLQLSNGNTFYLQFTKKKGIEVYVYNKERKLTAQKTIEGKLWNEKDINSTSIEGIYEIKGIPVIFLAQIVKRVPTLFRLRLDPNTGAIKEEKKIATLQKYKPGAGIAMNFGVKKPDFFVEKAANSDNYAVINFNTFAHESDERIEVIHFSDTHQELSRAKYDSHGYKYLNYMGMTVLDDKSVFVAAYGYHTKASGLGKGGQDSRIIISKLSKGSSEFKYKIIEFSDDFKDTKGIMKYNPGSNMLQLLTLTFINSKGRFMGGTRTSYVALLSHIDPESLFIVSTKPLKTEKARAFIKRKYDYNKPVGLLPQDMIINQDNSTTIISEEMIQTISTTNGAVTSVQTTLGATTITEFNEKGEEQEGIAVLKSQVTPGLFDAFYSADRAKGKWAYIQNGVKMNIRNSYMSFDYINTENGKYILYNDYPENYHADDKRKKKTISSISTTNTVCYKMKYAGYDMMTLFGTVPDNESKFSFIESSNFNQSTNTYAVIMMHRVKRKKEAKIAWMKFK